MIRDVKERVFVCRHRLFLMIAWCRAVELHILSVRSNLAAACLAISTGKIHVESRHSVEVGLNIANYLDI